MSDRETILEFKNVCKRFPGMEKNAVDSVNLSIKKGEFVTILGTSGSGKTTLMKMVNLLMIFLMEIFFSRGKVLKICHR